MVFVIFYYIYNFSQKKPESAQPSARNVNNRLMFVYVCCMTAGCQTESTKRVEQGGVILVSHDERLIRMICKELWVCGGGTVKSIEGGFDEYRKIVERELEALAA